MKIKSTFALLDVQTGRAALNRLIPKPGHYMPEGKAVPVVIRGYITHRHGGFDGVSQEFGVEVSSVEVADEL